MTVIERSALLSHPAEQIFDLVAEIERYPEFLDGCVGAEILERRDNTVTASLWLFRRRGLVTVLLHATGCNAPSP